MAAKIVFAAALLFAVSPLASPPLALALGLAFGLTFTHPFRARTQSVAKYLLQVCVVGLGFGLDLGAVLRAGASGFLYTALGIGFALLLGLWLGKLLQVRGTESFLIAVGTAVCGGSAIAAVGPVAGAEEDEMTVALGTVFVLNAVALILFPSIGLLAGLDESQFGLWAALAIHDTSSVVGASAKYGATALAVGTTIKLARALWIVPLAVATAALKRNGARIRWPWFVLFFLGASVLTTYAPAGAPAYAAFAALARVGLTVTLFLIGSQISRETLRSVGARPFLLGVLLWIAVATASLLLIRAGVIGI